MIKRKLMLSSLLLFISILFLLHPACSLLAFGAQKEGVSIEYYDEDALDTYTCLLLSNEKQLECLRHYKDLRNEQENRQKLLDLMGIFMSGAVGTLALLGSIYFIFILFRRKKSYAVSGSQ